MDDFEQQALLMPLLLLRQQRERKARSEQVEARGAFEQCEQATLKAQQSLRDFAGYRAAEEARLYTELRSRQVSPRSIDHYRSRIEYLQFEQANIEKEIRDCIMRQSESQQRLNVTRDVLQKAMRAVEKFEEILKDFDQRLSRSALLKEDAEIDEAAMTAWSLQRF